jgi:glycosyltransferase involved in cell wall biosynthesis
MARERLVSVIVPTHNRPALLRKALASIRAAEGNGLRFEILVADNGDAPETKQFVADFDAVYLPVTRQGPSPARNAALAVASGEFIGFLDDDDEWLPTNVRNHISIMDADPDIAAVFGQIVYVDQDLNPIGNPWPAEWPGEAKLFVTLLSGYYPQLGATVVRASVTKAIGLLDETLIAGEDWDWQLRIAVKYRIGFVSQPCVLTRVRPAGSFDEIQILRARYATKIFWRHALPNVLRWRSPLGFARSYIGVITHIYDYFVSAVYDRAGMHDRCGARRAVYHAFRLNPVRATKMLKDPRFFNAVKAALFRSDQADHAARD